MSHTQPSRLRSWLAAFVPLAACTASIEPAPGVPELVPVSYPDRTVTAVVGDVADAARGYVRAAGELTGADDDWQVRSTSTGRDGLHHVRLAQLHGGVPVWGGDVVVHATAARFLAVTGNRVAHLGGFDVAPVVAAPVALATAQADYARGGNGAALAFARPSTELVIYPQRGDARLAWHATFFTELQAGLAPGLWHYFIDAKTGAILDQINALDHLAEASGPGGNPKVARSWVAALDVEPSGSLYAMDTARLQTFDLGGATSGGSIVVGPLDNIGDAPINDAHGFAEQTLNMLRDWMGYNSIDNNGFPIKSRVHYGVGYENAFWDGTQMTYGDGAATFYPLSGAIDVVAHEIDHGFTTFHSNLTYSGMSGGMNESFSDIAGTIAEFYASPGSADFDIGRDIFRSSGALRYMCDPTADGQSIDNAADYQDWRDVHYTSGIMNKAFCRTARRLGSGSPDGAATATSVQRAGRAWYLANASYWTASSTFTQGCQGVMDAAAALGFSETERSAIRDSWSDVGVTCGGGGGSCRCSDKVCGMDNGCGSTCSIGVDGCTLRGESPVLWDVSGPFAPFIQGAVAAGFMTPQSPNIFGVSATVTRGEMATIIIRAKLGDAFTYPPTPYFTDVPATDWRFPYVQKLAELGITVGYGDGRFGVDDNLTRGQMAVFIMRALYNESSNGPQTYSAHPLAYFGDVREDHPFFRPIQRMREDGITSGVSADPAAYGPDLAIPREQMAVFIMRAFGGPSYAPTPYSCRPYTSCGQVGQWSGSIFNGCTTVSCEP